MSNKLEQVLCLLLAVCLIAIGFAVAFNLGQKAGEQKTIEHLQIDQVLHSNNEYGVVIYYKGEYYLHVCADH